MKQGLTPEQALRERTLKYVVDIMRICPCRAYRPTVLADELYRFVIEHTTDDATTVVPLMVVHPKTRDYVKELETIL